MDTANAELTAAGVTSASLPSVPRESLLPPQQPRCGYLSVRLLNPVVGLIFFHIKYGVAGPSRRGHVGRIAASVASPSAAFSSRVVSEGAAGKRNRFQEEKKKIDKHAGEARRPVFIVQP